MPRGWSRGLRVATDAGRFDSVRASSGDARRRRGRRAEDRTTAVLQPMSLEDMADSGEEYDDPPAITLGDLRDGESVTIRPSQAVETFTSQYADDGEENDALRWTAVLMRSDYAFRPEGADEIESGDAVTLISWSDSLAQAILATAEETDASDLTGEDVEIEKFGSGYEVSYRLRVGEDAKTE